MADVDPSQVILVNAAQTARDQLPSFLAQFLPLDALSHVWVAPLAMTRDDTGVKGFSSIVVDQEIGFSIPDVDAATIVIGPGEAGSVFSVELDVSPTLGISIQDVPVVLRLETTLFTPVVQNPQTLEYEPDPSRPFMDIVLGTISFSIDVDGHISFSVNQGFKLDPVMIGDSGVVIQADGISIQLGPDDQQKGVSIPLAKVTLPGQLGQGATLTMTNAFIGNGGFTGKVSASLTPQDEDLGGLTVALDGVSVDIQQNTLVDATLTGTMLLPYFDKRVTAQLTIGLNGDIGIAVIGIAPGDGTYNAQTGVLSLSAGPLKFDLTSVGIDRSGSTTSVSIAGKVTPTFQGLSFPSFDLQKASIDSNGHLSLSGGWVDLPKHVTLDLYGFKMELTKIGFGTDDDGAKWIGLSGALKLVDGIKAGASVKGLRISFHDLTSAPSLSLDGVGIDFEIPGSLSVTGSVSLTGQDFAGAVKVTVQPITLTIDGQFVTGKNPTTGGRYFGIFLQGDLPTGIAIGSTGLAIYGLAGLYGQGLAPSKTSTEDWYENPDATPGWYKRAPVGITSLNDKWTPTDGAYAFGAGVTIGTYADNGYEFSGALLLVLSFPGPTILIDGRANLFKKRAALSGGDPTFRALAVIQPNVSFLLGLDAHYKYKDSGELVDIKGSAEAFFNFQDPDDWHIYLGRKDPKLNARIAAKLFKLFDVNGYFELTPQQLAIGAAFSFDKKYGFSSLNVHVQASMQTDATVSWHPSHFNGDVILDGSAQLQAFGHGVGVKAHADITGDVFEPVHLHGDFSVGIDLPWPLPDIGASVSLDWQTPLDQPPVLPLPLHDATIEHGTRMLKWPIPRDPSNGALLPDLDGGDLELVGGGTLPPTPDDEQQPPPAAPRIPADSKVGLTFTRPINDAAHIGVNPASVLPEFVGDPTATTTGNPPTPASPQNPPTAASQQNPKSAYSVYYELSSVTLEKLVPAPGTADPSDLNPRWVQIAAAEGATQPDGVTQLFGAWAAVHPNASDPAANNEQLKLLVNAKTPYDYTSQQLQVYDTWFDTHTPGYPCQPLTTPDQKFCALFVDFQFILPDAKQINFTNPAFSVAWPDRAELSDSDADIPGGNGSRRSLGTVGTLDPDDAVQVVPPSGLNEVDIMVGTVDSAVDIDIVTVTPTVNMSAGNVLTLDTAVLTIFNTDDPNADLTPGPSPTKTPGIFTTGPDGGLVTGDLTEVSFAPAESALNVDVSFKADFPIVIDTPDGQAAPPQTAEIISYTDGPGGGQRIVQKLTKESNAFRIRFTGARIVRMAFRTTGGAQIQIFKLHARTPVSAIAFSDGGDQQFGPFEEVNGVITVVGQALGLIKLGTPRRCEFTIMEICTPDRTLELNRHTVQSLDLLTEIDPIFEPQADYRMVITTRRNSSPNPKNGDAGHANDKNKLVEQAYFHVVGPPGIEVPDPPVTDPPAATTGPTGFEDLSFYVAATVPDSTPASDGKPVLPRAYYRSYDVAIYFNQPSAVEQMYRLARRDLTLRLFDTANNPVLDTDGRAVVPTSRWDTAQQPTLTDAQARWVGQVNNSSCHPTDIPSFQVSSALTNQNVSAPAEIALLPETLYQARLVPALLHESFINPIPNLVADGQHQLERWVALNSVTAQPGRWVVDSDQVLDPSGKPVLGPDGKPVLTFFATETSGNVSTLIYQGPLGAPKGDPPDAPDQWTDYRVSAQFRWSTGSLIFSFRRHQTGNQIFIGLDRTSGLRTVVAVINGTQHELSADQPGFGGPDDDLQLSIDCVGDQLHITQTGVTAPLDLTLPAGASTQGTVGCLATGAAGCRFTEIRVDDLRSNPATAQRFDYVTSKYVNFAHHLASFDDQAFGLPATLGATSNDFTTNAGASLALPAGVGTSGSDFGLSAPTDDETRAFDALELITLGADGRLRAPAGVEISNATHDQTITALLIRSPEPIQWERTSLVSNVLPGTEALGLPGDVKLLRTSTGTTPIEESVTMIVRTARNLTSFQIQWRPVADTNNPNPDWATYYTFGAEPVFGDGIGVQVFSGSSDGAPAREPGTVQRFVAADAASAVTIFSDNLSGVELRVLDSTGAVVHQREFRPEGGISQQTAVNLFRKADGTAFFLFLTTAPPPGMRLDFVFTRNPGPSTSAPPFPILRQAGSDTAETASLTFLIVPG